MIFAVLTEVDIDKDGDIDIVGNNRGVMGTLLNDGQGSFSIEASNVDGRTNV